MDLRFCSPASPNFWATSILSLLLCNVIIDVTLKLSTCVYSNNVIADLWLIVDKHCYLREVRLLLGGSGKNKGLRSIIVLVAFPRKAHHVHTCNSSVVLWHSKVCLNMCRNSLKRARLMTQSIRSKFVTLVDQETADYS